MKKKKKIADGWKITDMLHPSWLDGYEDPNMKLPINLIGDQPLARINQPLNYSQQKLPNSAIPSNAQASLPIDMDYHMKKGINWQNVAIGALAGADALIPGRKPKQYIPQPMEEYNSFKYGTGSSAIMKAGGKVYKSKHYPDGGKVKPAVQGKMTDLNNPNQDYNMSLYTPFGTEAQKYKEAGWYPVQSTNGQTTYKNHNTPFNNIFIPNQKNSGYISLVGNSNGTFNLSVNDAQEKPLTYMTKGAPISSVNDFISKTITGYTNNLKKKAEEDGSLINVNTNTDKLAATFKHGGKMKKAKDGNSFQSLYEDGGEYDLPEEEINNLISKGYKVEYL